MLFFASEMFSEGVEACERGAAIPRELRFPGKRSVIDCECSLALLKGGVGFALAAADLRLRPRQSREHFPLAARRFCFSPLGLQCAHYHFPVVAFILVVA